MESRQALVAENPLVAFTLVSQAVIGAFTILFLGGLAGIDALSAPTETLAPIRFSSSPCSACYAGVLFLSTQHLGKPMRFYRGFNNFATPRSAARRSASRCSSARSERIG